MAFAEITVIKLYLSLGDRLFLILLRGAIALSKSSILYIRVSSVFCLRLMPYHGSSDEFDTQATKTLNEKYLLSDSIS